MKTGCSGDADLLRHVLLCDLVYAAYVAVRMQVCARLSWGISQRSVTVGRVICTADVISLCDAGTHAYPHTTPSCKILIDFDSRINLLDDFFSGIHTFQTKTLLSFFF